MLREKLTALKFINLIFSHTVSLSYSPLVYLMYSNKNKVTFNYPTVVMETKEHQNPLTRP